MLSTLNRAYSEWGPTRFEAAPNPEGRGLFSEDQNVKNCLLRLLRRLLLQLAHPGGARELHPRVRHAVARRGRQALQAAAMDAGVPAPRAAK